MSRKKKRNKARGGRSSRGASSGPSAAAAPDAPPARSRKAAAHRRRPFGLLWLAGAAALGLLVYFVVLKPGRNRFSPAGRAPRNILLITLDTTRADHLGSYGYAEARTPALDGLARAGIRFSRAYCPAPLTFPSHCSIMTGLYPVRHGVRNNGHELPGSVKTLAEIFKSHGFATAAFVSSFSVDSRFGLNRGFDVYDDTFPSESPVKTENAERRAEGTYARFARWLEKNAGSPFFCWVHYYDPHFPYDPPSPYKEEFAGRLYDGEIAYMDHYVGAMLDQLKARGIFENTLIVVAGDHGEGLGAKVELGHGIFLYEETLRVPLIIHEPQIFPQPRVIPSEVRLIDAAPTILEAAGLASETAGMQGLSLAAWCGGRAGKDRDSLIESFYPRENFGWSELVGVVSGSWKYIQAPVPELYDLGRDPEEKKNLVLADAARAATLKKQLEQTLLASGAGDSGRSGGESKRSAADMEKLRSLGYVNFAPAKPGASLPDPKDKAGMLRLIQQAQNAEFEGRYADAEDLDRQILAGVPDAPASYINLALVQAMQKKFDQAVATLQSGTARIPDSETLLVRLGHTYLVAGRLREAHETMDKVLALNPRDVDALSVCAGILESAGEREQARSFFERALAVEPENRALRMSLAANLASGGRLKEAADIYIRLAADFPEEQAFSQYAGIAFSYLGQYDQAITYLKQAVAIKPTPVGYFNLAVAYEKSGNIPEAVNCLKTYLNISQGESPDAVRKARAELERLEKTSGLR